MYDVTSAAEEVAPTYMLSHELGAPPRYDVYIKEIVNVAGHSSPALRNTPFVSPVPQTQPSNGQINHHCVHLVVLTAPVHTVHVLPLLGCAQIQIIRCTKQQSTTTSDLRNLRTGCEHSICTHDDRACSLQRVDKEEVVSW